MFSNHPALLGAGLIGACSYSFLLKGTKALKSNLKFTLFMVLCMSLLNGLFTHNGVTLLGYFWGKRITAEALIYGAVMAVLMSEIFVWFGSFQVIMSSDKFIYLFGKLAPVLGLTMSMIFRFIPLLTQRFKEIHNGQICMGRTYKKYQILGKTRQFFKELSILISWSLEASIESSDSMEARGYGLSGRSSFHLYRFQRRDLLVLLGILFLGGIALGGCMLGAGTIYYYPSVWIPRTDQLFWVTWMSYIGLMLIPMIIDWKGERKWKQLHSKM